MPTVKISALSSASGGNAADVAPIVQAGTTKKVALAELFSGSSGGQIAFPATQNASAGANTLDDYEEGTFTPTIIGTGTVGAGTYSVQSGVYTKVGRIVFYSFSLTWSAHTGTTNMQFGGLPFTAAAAPDTVPASVIHSNLAGTAGEQILAGVIGGTATGGFWSCDPGGTALAAVALDTAATVAVSGFYFV